MKKIWQPEELVEYWTLLPLELALLNQKNDENLLGFAILLKFFDIYARFPENNQEISKWQEIILETGADDEIKVNRINYELSVLQALREKLRCKEIWVVGANRYRNPEEDLPADFEAQRLEYFQALKQPSDVEVFIANLQQSLEQSLTLLDKGMLD